MRLTFTNVINESKVCNTKTSEIANDYNTTTFKFIKEIKVQEVHQRQKFLSENQELLELRLLTPLGKYLYK